MGLAIAVDLLKAGFQVYGYDLDPKTLKQLKAAGGTPQKIPPFWLRASTSPAHGSTTNIAGHHFSHSIWV